MRVFVVAGLMLTMAGSVLAMTGSALAQDYEEGSLRREADRVVRDRGVDGIRALLESATVGDRFEIGRSLDAARVALTHLPAPEGTAAAARFCDDVLTADRTHADAWTVVHQLRRRISDSLDTETGIWFLARLHEHHPEATQYRLDLALLLKDTGRSTQAVGALRAIVADTPDSSRARWNLAVLEELAGRFDAAIEQYDALIKANGDLSAHAYKVAVLRHSKKDLVATDLALAAAFAALESADPSSTRNDVRASLEYQRDMLVEDRARRAKLLSLTESIDRRLKWTLGIWVFALLGTGVLLRRRGIL